MVYKKSYIINLGALGHETRMFIHMIIDTMHIVIWKSRDNPFKVGEL